MSILCWQCRAGTESQLATKLGTTLQVVESLGKRLAREGFIVRKRQTAVDYDLSKPLAVSGQEVDFGNVAWKLEQRWHNASRHRATVLWATPMAVRFVGGVSGRLRQPLQLQHDLGVTEVLTKSSMNKGEKWIGEDAYREFWQKNVRAKVPDAVVLNQNEQIGRVIEFGGRYSKERLRRFARYWMARGILYEIW